MSPDDPSGFPYRQAFLANPSALLLLDADLRVLDVNDAYVTATQHTREQLVGDYVFNHFPDNPHPPLLASADVVRESMLRARDTGTVDQLVGRRYDIAVPGSDTFATRYWNLTTVPIVDRSGATVLLHRVQDVTAALASEAAEATAVGLNDELLERVASAQADLLVRAQELQVLNDRLRRTGLHDRTVAQALQAAMLPTLPQVDGLHLVGRYIAAGIDNEVGGDWYDAIVDADGAPTMIIGDVMGHDIGAAATMGQVRSMLRAFTWNRQQPPSQIVAMLDRAVRDLRMNTMATLIVLRVERPGVDAVGGGTAAALTLRWTVAGHPPAVLVAADGTTTVLDDGHVDPPLGVVPDTARHDHTHPLPAGSAVVLYTDGLIETRHDDLARGIGRLRAALTSHHTLPLEAMLDAVITDMVGDHPADDVAVLALTADDDDVT